MTENKKLTEYDLSRFNGSEKWYRHGLNRKVLFTEGAKYVADQGEAYWLLDTIAICQRSEKHVTAEPFQVWKLNVVSGRSATLVCGDGRGNIVYRQSISFTDFPLN
jgi:hypothetical protein